MKYKWYHTAFRCGDCGHQFVRATRRFSRSVNLTCPKCKSDFILVDQERDLDITEAIAKA